MKLDFKERENLQLRMIQKEPFYLEDGLDAEDYIAIPDVSIRESQINSIYPSVSDGTYGSSSTETDYDDSTPYEIEHNDPSAISQNDHMYSSVDSIASWYSGIVSDPVVVKISSKIYQDILSDMSAATLLVDIDDCTSQLEDVNQFKSLMSVLLAIFRLCETKQLCKSKEKLSPFLRKYRPVVSRFIDEEYDQIHLLKLLEVI